MTTPVPTPSSAGLPSLPTLFLVVLGGRTARSHIELHDVRFVAGYTIDDTLPELRRQWFGRREGLHLDALRLPNHCRRSSGRVSSIV